MDGMDFMDGRGDGILTEGNEGNEGGVSLVSFVGFCERWGAWQALGVEVFYHGGTETRREAGGGSVSLCASVPPA
jgi:hypothetical protein